SGYHQCGSPGLHRGITVTGLGGQVHFQPGWDKGAKGTEVIKPMLPARKMSIGLDVGCRCEPACSNYLRPPLLVPLCWITTSPFAASSSKSHATSEIIMFPPSKQSELIRFVRVEAGST